MRVYYFNDTDKAQKVFVGDLMSKPEVLEPATGKEFWTASDESDIPFVKVWNTMVLISTKESDI